MMYRMLVVVVFLLIGCSQSKNEAKEESCFRKVTPKYSKLFYKEVYSDREELVLINPWDSLEVYARYVVESKNVKGKKSILLSGASIGFLTALDKLEHVTGVGLKKYVYQKELLEENIVEVGETHQLNIERVIALNVDYLFVSGFEKQNKNFELVKRGGVEVIQTLEWMEGHPLARAEWMKFYGAIFGEEPLADSLFLAIESEYNRLSVLDKKVKPTVMFGNNYKEVWYTPKGGSYMAKLMEDAGGEYYWKKEKGTGSLALSVEDVVKNQIQSSFWFNPGSVSSLEELKSTSPLLQEFNCVKKGSVYNYSKRTSSTGGNDFWESGVVYPNLLLKDYIQIIHPGLLGKQSLYYYEKLK